MALVKLKFLIEDGVRLKERLDNDDLVAQLEARIRAKAAQLDQKNRIDIKQVEQD